MSIDNFNIILDKIFKYTDYLYLHILGEPLMHPNINELIDCASKKFKVNITTNGYLIDRIKTKNIRQLNISLHSYSSKYNIKLDDYLDKVFNKIDKLDKTYISLRLWVKNKHNKEIINYINNRYKVNIQDNTDNYKINNHIFMNNFQEFIWPDLKNNYYNVNGTCYGLNTHIGILVDGTVIPCCLDSRGVINLGNIYNDSLEEILKSNRVNLMTEGFKCNEKIEELCKHCNFIQKNN